jgi:hypothetical protein
MMNQVLARFLGERAERKIYWSSEFDLKERSREIFTMVSICQIHCSNFFKNSSDLLLQASVRSIVLPVVLAGGGRKETNLGVVALPCVISCFSLSQWHFCNFNPAF